MAIDVIEWTDDSGELMVYRYPRSDIRLGAQLTVRESQAAVFFRDGKALDVFKPGRHTLDTDNIPILATLISIPFGFRSPFQAEVYFVNLKVFPEEKWGTREPVLFRDTEFHTIRLRAFGTYALRVSDPQMFVNTVVGTQGYYSSAEVQSFLRGIIVSRLNDLLGETLKTILDLPGVYDELAAGVRARVTDDFNQYGIELRDLYIEAITPPEEVQKLIDERSGMEAVGDMNRFMQFKAAQSLQDAAKQEGGGGAMGMGLGAGLGMMIPGMVQQAQQPAAQTPPAAQPTAASAASAVKCAECGAAIAENAHFCPGCGAKVTAPAAKAFCTDCGKEIPVGAKFCPLCGAKQGA